MKRIMSFLIVAGLLTACSSPVRPGLPTETSQRGDRENGVRLVQAEVPRQEPQGVGDPDVDRLVQGLNTLGVDLYKITSQSGEENLIFSPYSIALAFSMAYGGAMGQTEAQMMKTLGYLPQTEQHPTFNALDQYLAALGESPEGQSQANDDQGEAFQLDVANAVWGQAGFPFKDAYLQTLAEYYGAGLREVDFAQNPEAARERINQWVAEQTKDKIKDLAPQGSINASTRLVLANAIYFKAAWLYPFMESVTRQEDFTLLDRSQVEADMMHGGGRFPYSQGDGYQALQIPYTGDKVDLLVVLPDEGLFGAIEDQLSVEFLERVRDEMETHDVSLAMPRFDFDSEIDLVRAFQAMGMTDPFSGEADFSGMVEGGGLSISAAQHKGTIKVDEIGTEASAATMIAVGVSAIQRAEVTLDRPFIFAIVERETGSILFLGRVVNPTH
jgi:serpin B